ncbi:MAG: MMPL family transporter [Hyphomicrobiaceae bacterium]|nr:MMPL family transporter [Hyphomicrobiaceae bacterium]
MNSLGFGLERMGLPAVRWPLQVLALLIAFSAFCAMGIPYLKTNHTLSELFHSDSIEFDNYKKMSEKFPTSEFDVLVVIESDNLMNPETLEHIRSLHLDLQLAETVEGILSIFSMREPPDATGYPPPLLPTELPKGEEFEKLAKRVVDHPLIGGKLLSKPDGGSQLTLLILNLNQDKVWKKGLVESIREIEQISKDVLEPEGLRVQLTGAPVMQLEIREAITRDRLIYNGTGFAVGMLICFAFFRRVKLVFITSLCPAVAVLWAMGLLGWTGLQLNTFINVIPPLVMVIAFTDAMHMVFSIRRRLGQGDNRFAAAKHAILTVGPACVLTSITTSIAFLSLMLTDSVMIRTFGIAAALATLLAFVTVIVLLPIMVVLLFRDEKEFMRTEGSRNQAIVWLERICTDFAGWMKNHYNALAIVGLVSVFVFTVLHLQLQPRYRLSDQVPDTKQSIATTERLDAKLTGAHPVHIMLEWPEGKKVTDERVVEALAGAHNLIETAAGVGNVWSVETLRQWLIDAGEMGPGVLADYISRLPEHLAQRFISKDESAALVTGRLPNLDAEDTVPVLEKLDASLSDLRAKYPEVTFTVTGLSAVSALRSSEMIRQLNRGLIAAIVVVILVIGIAFRSFKVMLLSIFPNLFPIVTAGALLYLIGGGLEYASVIALTVAFGIAVDDTIHFLNRLHLETSRAPNLVDGVTETISRIGPVLVLTTLVLIVGLSATILSDLPSMRLFGQLFMTTLSAAIFGDLLILPAIVLAARKFGLAKTPDKAVR